MLPSSEHHQISARFINNPDILRLYDEWQEARPSGGGLPPAEFGPGSPLSPNELWCANDLMLLEQQPDGDFVYRHYGANVARSASFNMLGKRTSDFQGELGAFFLKKYQSVLASGQPLYTTHRAVRAKGVLTWERLILPLAGSEDAGAVLLVYNRPMAFANELLVSVLDASPDCVLVLDATDTGELTVGLLNRRAEKEFGITSDGALMQPVGEVLPDVFDAELLGQCASVLDSAEDATAVHTRVGSGQSYRVTLSPISRGLVANFTDITELLAANARLHELATTDALTGLANRRHLLDCANIECQRSRRHGGRISLLMLDLDEFKRTNDSHGHAVGDRVLQTVAGVLRAKIRVHDLAGRLGGEEFAVLLPETPLESAAILAERLRVAIAAATVAGASGEVRFTTSIGVAAHRDDELDILAALTRADEQLYRAKDAGRNCLRVAAR